MHEAIQAYLRTPKREAVPENERCVGCDVARGGERGWCDECWRGICPDEPSPAVSEPFDTGCGRR